MRTDVFLLFDELILYETKWRARARQLTDVVSTDGRGDVMRQH
jgi:hypothetical protein